MNSGGKGRQKEQAKDKTKDKDRGKRFSAFDQETTAEGEGGGDGAELEPLSSRSFDDCLSLELGAFTPEQEESKAVQLGGVANGVTDSQHWSTKGMNRARLWILTNCDSGADSDSLPETSLRRQPAMVRSVRRQKVRLTFRSRWITNLGTSEWRTTTSDQSTLA